MITILLVLSSVIVKAKETNLIKDSTIYIIDSLKQELSKPLPDSVRVNILDVLGYRLMYINPVQAISYLEEGIQLTSKHNNAKKVRLLAGLGNVYYVLGDFSKALFYNFQALRIAEKPKEQADILVDIGVDYVAIKQYTLAGKYFRAALSIKLKNGEYKKLSITYNNLGLLAAMQGNMQLCITYCLKAIELEQKYPSGFSLSIPYNNVAEAYADLNQLQEAKVYYTKALEATKNMDDVANHYINMGSLSMKQLHFNEAITYFLKAEEIAKEYQLKAVFTSLYNIIATAYAKQKNFEMAYSYKEKHTALMDELFNERVTKEMNEMQAKYETEKKNEEIRTLSKDKEIIQAKAERKQSVRNLFIAVFAFMFIISLVVSRNIVLKQRMKNRVLNEEKVLIELQNKQAEKDNVRLLNENTEARYEALKSKTNPHFLFNSLNILSSVVLKNPPLAAEYLEQFSDLYRRILNTSDQKLVSLDEELQVVQHYLSLQKMRFKENLSFNIDIMVDAKQFFVPPFAVQLVTENAIKHNIITRLRPLKIEIYTLENEIIITNNLQKKAVTDMESTSTGLKNIKGRYNLLTNIEPLFIETEKAYIVKLPLLEDKLAEVFSENV